MKTIRLTEVNGDETVVVLDKIVRISTQHSNLNNDVYSVIHTVEGYNFTVREEMDEIEALISGRKKNKIVQEQYLMKEIMK